MVNPIELTATYAGNFRRNLFGMFEGMTLERYIRIVVIVGAYLLLRPYLMKLGAKLQAREHEKEIDPSELTAAVSPNSLRGQVEIPEDSDNESESEHKGADWGKKARRRQRHVLRKVLEADEKLRKELQEDDEDKDIAEFLVD